MTNDELYNKAREAIIDLFSDTSVSMVTCYRNMQSLIDEINILMDASEYDGGRENEDD